MTDLIKINDLKKHYGKQSILKGISATVEQGKVISIIGPSGAGKSTFLRCLNG
ncbi:MAG: ATP-binding cassette domain-containing protein, partial [Lactobacillus iners]|nr:ATP-binding cassette domain-containing protein [Lactobacillus iners]